MLYMSRNKVLKETSWEKVKHYKVKWCFKFTLCDTLALIKENSLQNGRKNTKVMIRLQKSFLIFFSLKPLITQTNYGSMDKNKTQTTSLVSINLYCVFHKPSCKETDLMTSLDINVKRWGQDFSRLVARWNINLFIASSRGLLGCDAV